MIDTHCHLAGDGFLEDLDAVVARARTAGVEQCLCIIAADDAAELDRVETVTAAWPAVRYAAGIHPHQSGDYADRQDAVTGVLTNALDRTEAVAVGEIGLDYHYNPAPRPVQMNVFEAQVRVAASRDLPVVIHTREAVDDTLAILRESGQGVRFVLHCFTGTPAEAEAAVALGGFLSFSGIATFPKGAELREIAARVPAGQLMLETDAPFLAPVPHRGKRNEPSFVVETYRVVAAARGVTPTALAETVAANFNRFLGVSAAVRAR